MERQTEPPNRPKNKNKNKKEKRENQNTTMACICIEVKERIERGKKSVPQGKKKMRDVVVRLTEEESRPAKSLKRMKGKFLRRSKRKISQKGEKRK